jgi:hypothetical protein
MCIGTQGVLPPGMEWEPRENQEEGDADHKDSGER